MRPLGLKITILLYKGQGFVYLLLAPLSGRVHHLFPKGGGDKMITTSGMQTDVLTVEYKYVQVKQQANRVVLLPQHSHTQYQDPPPPPLPMWDVQVLAQLQEVLPYGGSSFTDSRPP